MTSSIPPDKKIPFQPDYTPEEDQLLIELPGDATLARFTLRIST
jgi:hypothetical protein